MAIILIVILLVVISLWIYKEKAQRDVLKNVEVSVDGISPKSIGLTNATVEIMLRIYNPNIITATLDRVDYKLYGNGNYIGSGNIDRRIDIPSRSSRTVITDFDLSYGGTLETIWSAIQNGNVNWKINGIAYFDTPLGSLNIPFNKVINGIITS